MGCESSHMKEAQWYMTLYGHKQDTGLRSGQLKVSAKVALETLCPLWWLLSLLSSSKLLVHIGGFESSRQVTPSLPGVKDQAHWHCLKGTLACTHKQPSRTTIPLHVSANFAQVAGFLRGGTYKVHHGIRGQCPSQTKEPRLQPGREAWPLCHSILTSVFSISPWLLVMKELKLELLAKSGCDLHRLWSRAWHECHLFP